MTTLDAYAAFLAARWDELEAVAREAAEAHDEADEVYVSDGVRVGVEFPPAYVLADLAAKRAVLAQCGSLLRDWEVISAPDYDHTFPGVLPHEPRRRNLTRQDAAFAQRILDHLAEPFRDHPDHPANQEQPMSIWTMEQVRQVQRLRADAIIDDELVHRHGDAALDTVRDKMVKTLVDMAHPFAVEPHHADFVLSRDELPDRPWQIRVRLQWAPTTNTVTLRGGARDGQRVTVRKVGDPLHVEILQETPWVNHDATHTEIAFDTNRVTYQLAGWHETERCWVYEVND